MVLREAILIRTTPEAFHGFFRRMAEIYRVWHPDHVLFRWDAGPDLSPGAGFYFEERIAGKLLKKHVRFTRVEPHCIEFAPTGRLFRLFLPRIRFRLDPAGDGFLMTQEIHIRTGPVGAWLNAREFDAVRAHMRLEGQTMKRMLEA